MCIGLPNLARQSIEGMIDAIYLKYKRKFTDACLLTKKNALSKAIETEVEASKNKGDMTIA